MCFLERCINRKEIIIFVEIFVFSIWPIYKFTMFTNDDIKYMKFKK